MSLLFVAFLPLLASAQDYGCYPDGSFLSNYSCWNLAPPVIVENADGLVAMLSLIVAMFLLVTLFCVSSWIGLVEWRTPIMAKLAYNTELLSSLQQSIAEAEQKIETLKQEIEEEAELVAENVEDLEANLEADNEAYRLFADAKDNEEMKRNLQRIADHHADKQKIVQVMKAKKAQQRAKMAQQAAAKTQAAPKQPVPKPTETTTVRQKDSNQSVVNSRAKTSVHQKDSNQSVVNSRDMTTVQRRTGESSEVEVNPAAATTVQRKAGDSDLVEANPTTNVRKRNSSSSYY